VHESEESIYRLNRHDEDIPVEIQHEPHERIDFGGRINFVLEDEWIFT
jgi:hypothetical protein